MTNNNTEIQLLSEWLKWAEVLNASQEFDRYVYTSYSFMA